MSVTDVVRTPPNLRVQEYGHHGLTLHHGSVAERKTHPIGCLDTAP